MQTLKSFLVVTLLVGFLANPSLNCLALIEYPSTVNNEPVQSSLIQDSGESYTSIKEALIERYSDRITFEDLKAQYSVDGGRIPISIYRGESDFSQSDLLPMGTNAANPVIPNNFATVTSISDFSSRFATASVTIPNAATFVNSPVLTGSSFNFNTTASAAGAQVLNQMDVQAIQGLITANNNQPVAVAPANQQFNLNNDQFINSADVSLMNNVVHFTSLTVAQQAATIASLKPELAAVVVNAVIGQASTNAERTQATDAIATIFEAMPSADSAEVVNYLMKTDAGQATTYAVVNQMDADKAAAVLNSMATSTDTATAQASLQNAAKILQNINEAQAIEAVASNNFTPQGIANVISSMSSLDRAAKFVQKLETSKAASILQLLQPGKSADLIATIFSQATTDQQRKEAAGLIATIFANQSFTAAKAAEILSSAKITTEQAAAVFTAMCNVRDGSEKAARILNDAKMDDVKASGILVKMYNDAVSKAAAGEPATALIKFMTMVSNYNLTSAKAAAIFSKMSAQDASAIIKSMSSTNISFFAQKTSSIYRALLGDFKAAVKAQLGDNRAMRVENYRINGTRANIGMYGDLDIWLTGDDALTRENIGARNIGSANAYVVYTYADGTTYAAFIPIGADDIDVFGHVNLMLDIERVEGAVSIDTQLYYWKPGDPRDTAHAQLLGDQTTVYNPDIFTFVMRLPEIDVVSGKPGGKMTFDFDGKVDIGDLVGGGVWIDYKDPAKQDQFYMLDDFEYMVDPITGRFELNIPAGVQLIKVLGSQRHGSTVHDTFSSTITFDETGKVTGQYAGLKK